MLRVFEAFAGIGTQRMALKRLNIPHEVVGISEIDKYALQAYEAIHGDCFNFGDITQLNPNDLPDFDLFTYSFPCQDLSIAGQKAGMIRGQTRSGLLYECEKIIEAKRPTYLLLENVKQLVGTKFKGQFEAWLDYLESLGYTNYWSVLNAKDYGVPQNRERVFALSILNEATTFQFPEKRPLTRCIEDILEPQVEEKYYLNKPFHLLNQDREATHERILIRGRVEGLNDQLGRVYDPKGICCTLDTMQGGHRQPKILEAKLIEVAKLEGKYDQSNRVYSKDGICPTIMAGVRRTCTGGYNGPKILDESHFKVRKLTPLECWRLMGISDEDYGKVKSLGMSNTQLYRQAGNAIVVDVLEAIFKQLFDTEQNKK